MQAVRPGRSETGRSLFVRLTDDTVVDRSALAPGKLARFLVRLCKGDERRNITAKVIALARNDGAGTGEAREPSPTTEPKPEPALQPKPVADSCGRGETNAVLVSASSTSVTLRTSSGEGTREWTVAVIGDTVVRKNDLNVELSALSAGDLVHVVIVRCTSGSVRALRIVFLQAAGAPA